jgi:hypothetical protein
VKLYVYLAIAVILAGSGTYAWHWIAARDAAIFLAGQRECQDATTKATNETLIADAIKQRDEAVAQAARAQASTQALIAEKAVAISQHDEVKAKAAADLEAAKAGKPSCPPLTDKYVQGLNAPLKATPATNGALK